ncbi:MAG: transporter [Syntrophobacteraceae bacterium]
MKKGVLLNSRLRNGLIIFTLVIGLMGLNPCWANDLPALNLGLTSFLDGGPPAGPGFYFSQYFQYYRSTKLADAKGHGFLTDDELDVFVSLSQFIYQSSAELLPGVRPGICVNIPIVAFDLDHASPWIPIQDNGAGVGDILVGPFLQWDPIMCGNRPIFVHRIELSMIFPTGKYDSNRELNPGSNFFSFNPYWAATVFPTPKWEVSWRIHYLWNAENDDPNRNYFPADDTQAGQAIHLNFATSYEIIEKRLRAGLNGYYLKQITDTQADGHDISGSREQVLGIGPGAVLHYSKDTHFFMNFYAETEAENRTEGYRLNLRLVHHF